MVVIAVYSAKGGVGKTTLAVDLAWRCAVQGGHRTLLWDLDPQGGSGFLLNMPEPDQPRAASVFQREGRPARLVAPTAWPGLSLLAADESLRALPLHLARLGQKRRLAGLTRELSAQFGRIMLDCPPMRNEVSEQVLAAADLVIVPLPPSPLSARALAHVRRDLSGSDGWHPPLLPVLSMVDARRRAHREALAGPLRAFPAIPWASAIEQTAYRRAPIGSFAPNSEPSRAMERVWRAIEFKLHEEMAA